jgi:hypothetical protein
MEVFGHFFKGMQQVLVPELGIFFGVLIALLMLIILVACIFKLAGDAILWMTKD